MPPLDTRPLAAPERAEGGQQDADNVLSGYSQERAPVARAHRSHADDQRAGGESAKGRAQDAVELSACRGALGTIP